MLRAALCVLLSAWAAHAAPLKVLFLGDSAGHKPAARFAQLEPPFKKAGIDLTYTDNVADLNAATLAKYDGLMVFANIDTIAPDQAKALLDYVASGKGFIPVHCASFCFRNSDPVVKLIGAQFRSHGTGVFRVETVAAEHPVMKGFDSFSCWDETYVHTKHNPENRTVLEVRKSGDVSEPWTWVRTHEKGRVFYTAWGHDHRTWSHPGFINLLERGTRWACGDDPAKAGVYIDRPKMTEFAKDAKPVETMPGNVPFYPPGEKWGTQREPLKSLPKPLPAAESLKHYQTPVDFEMKAFVTEEKLGGGKPICMTWDERGRLWLGLTYDYPNEMKPAGEGRDRIVVCEDVDGDGACDTVTVFAEKLSIPTGILNYAGGVIVLQAPDTLFLKDADGDGKADVRETLFGGWGTKDTHAGPSNLRYGPDGWVYGMCGYSGFDGTVAGERVRFGQGLFRIKAVAANGKLAVEKLEFLRSTNNNSWGVGFAANGELFGSTANGCPLVHLTIPNRYFEKVKGLTPGPLQNIALDNHYEPATATVRQVDQHGGFTSAAGCCIYTAKTYPKEYWDRTAFVSDPTGHLTAALVLEPHGSSYIARYGWNLVAANDEWAAPIDAQVGPDGHVWVLDWYSYIVQHNPTPQGFKTGKGNAYETPLRDKQHGRVYRVVYTKAKPEPRINLKDATKEQLVETLTHHNMGWRLHAQRLLLDGRLPGSPKPLESVNAEPDTRERLRKVLALADEKPGSGQGAYLASQVANLDPNTADAPLTQALTIAASVHDAEFLAAILKEKTAPAAGPVIELVARNYAAKAPADGVATVLVALAGGENAAARTAVLNGFAAGWPAKGAANLTPESEKAVGTLMAKLDPAGRGRLMKLSAAWGVKGLDAQLAELAANLVAVAADESKSDSDRLEAAKQAMEYLPESDAAAAKLVAAVTAKSKPAFATALFEVLGTSRAKGLGAVVVAKLADVPAAAKPAAIRLALARPESAKAFLDAVEAGSLRFDLLALDQKTALAAHPDKTIADRATKLLKSGGGLPDADRQKVIEQYTYLLKKTGDPGLGKKAFTQHCGKCHKHGGEGQIIGPDLTGFAVHPKEEILIHVLDPSRSVEGNFKAYTAKLSDGRVVTGLLASETKTAVELVDAENKRHPFEREDIEELRESKKSLMPEGFEKTMTADEMANLLEFLVQKGRFVPIPLDKYATAVSTRGLFYDPEGTVERIVFKDWKPKEFAGVPFYLVDPMGDKQKNVILLNSPNGVQPKTMPKTVSLPCNTKAKAIHFLSGVGGWNAMEPGERGVSLIVRFKYDDGTTEDHPLKDGVHFADYIRRIDVPGSAFAFDVQGKQVRYLKVEPKKAATIAGIDLIKGGDRTAPLVIAVTIETP